MNSKGQVCAVKTFHVDTSTEGIDIGILRELVYLKSIRPHANIIQLGEIEHDSVTNKIRVEMPLYDIDLNKFVKQEREHNPLSLVEIQKFSFQIVSALQHCHKHGVFHRDVKPANILLDKQGNLVLCDFSLASNFVSKIDHSKLLRNNYLQTLTFFPGTTVQTLWYRAIEIIMGSSKYDTGVDIWSFGCVLGFMLTGNDLMKGDSEWGQLVEIYKLMGKQTTSNFFCILFETHFLFLRNADFGTVA